MSELSPIPQWREPDLFEVDLATVPPELRRQARQLLLAIAAMDAQVVPVCTHESVLHKEGDRSWFYEEIAPQAQEPDLKYLTFLAASVAEAEKFARDNPGNQYRTNPRVVVRKLCELADRSETDTALREFPFRFFRGKDGGVIIDVETIPAALTFLAEHNITTTIGVGGKRFLKDFANAHIKDKRDGKIKPRTYKVTARTRHQAS